MRWLIFLFIFTATLFPLLSNEKRSSVPDQHIIKLIEDAVYNEFGKFELILSASVGYNDKAEGYIWLITNEKAGNTIPVLVTYKYELNNLTLLDVNKEIVSPELVVSNPETYFFTRKDNMAFLHDGYGTVFHLLFDTNGVYVDAVEYTRLLYGVEDIKLESVTFGKDQFGKIRLKDFSRDIFESLSDKYKPEVKILE